MATRRDLVEAQAFSRRRLVTAFVCGAPGGREVEAARPGRTIVGGAVLAVLLLAGEVAGSVLAGRTAADWDHPGMVISQERGRPYAITHRGLQPVVNPTTVTTVTTPATPVPDDGVVVPDTWMKLFRPGPVLSPRRARCTAAQDDCR